MEDFAYADIIFFALLAAYILTRLRATLGRDDGNRIAPKKPLTSVKSETKKPVESPAKSQPDSVIKPVVEKEYIEPEIEDKKIKAAIKKIKDKDSSFNLGHFLYGADAAFEMVMEAYNSGDKDALKHLLAPNIYKGFEAEIDKREKSKNKEDTTLLAVLESSVKAVSLHKNEVSITVYFKSEQVTLVKDSEGKIVKGDPSDVQEVEDEWTFHRNLSSQNPNWTIITLDS